MSCFVLFWQSTCKYNLVLIWSVSDWKCPRQSAELDTGSELCLRSDVLGCLLHFSVVMFFVCSGMIDHLQSEALFLASQQCSLLYYARWIAAIQVHDLHKAAAHVCDAVVLQWLCCSSGVSVKGVVCCYTSIMCNDDWMQSSRAQSVLVTCWIAACVQTFTQILTYLAWDSFWKCTWDSLSFKTMLGKHGFFNCMYQTCTIAYIDIISICLAQTGDHRNVTHT